MINTSFSTDELQRYSQQIKLSEIGLSGQKRLKEARVLCAGLGGLGSSLLIYLAAAGVGRLGLVDDDTVELSNLQRQVLYRSPQISSTKTASAAAQILALDPDIQVDVYHEKLREDNVVQLISQYDIVADCSDNFYSNYLIHDNCFKLKKPYVYASVSQFQGYCCLFNGKEGPCLRCLFPAPSDPNLTPNCNLGGVLGTVPGILGIIQATEIIKWLLQIGCALEKRFLRVNLLNMTFKEMRLAQNPDCQLCIHQSPPQLTYPLPQQSLNLERHAITVENMFALLQHSAVSLIDVRSATEHQAHNIGGKLLPLSELPERLNELNSQHTIILYCHSGKRSLQALSILLDAGFSSVKYLMDGIGGCCSLLA